MSNPHIEFQAPGTDLDKLIHPYPAIRAMPEWYRQMPVESQGHDTVKRCMPFLDAMTSGYIIPLQVDVKISLSESGLNLQFTPFKPPQVAPVQVHVQEQFPGAPFPQMPAIKFNSPWVIRTPPGYSTLFVAPMNRFAVPIMPLSGIVDTDTFALEVTFPALCLLQRGDSVELPRGTPLVQAIPFRRDTWTSGAAPLDGAAHESHQAEAAANHRFYRDRYWQKKSFT
ncbi:MAG: hypothetical protein QOF78_569 [Phycisphaerales bacterium]|nr:hypothetical protein [Phycisphaerales bacterium]